MGAFMHEENTCFLDFNHNFAKVFSTLKIAIGFWRFAEEKHTINHKLDLMEGDRRIHPYQTSMEFEELINLGQTNMVISKSRLKNVPSRTAPGDKP